MSVCRARSLSLVGIDALPVEVEVDVSAGLPGFSIVGLPDAAVQEARERVRVAISNSGYKFPTKKVIVNLAPANLRIGKPYSPLYPAPDNANSHCFNCQLLSNLLSASTYISPFR